MADSTVGAPSSNDQTTDRNRLQDALLMFAGGMLLLGMGVLWWLNPPRFETVAVHEWVLRGLDLICLVILVLLWALTPFFGAAWLGLGGWNLTRLTYTARRRPRPAGRLKASGPSPSKRPAARGRGTDDRRRSTRPLRTRRRPED
jgi:hypothetical protein